MPLTIIGYDLEEEDKDYNRLYHVLNEEGARRLFDSQWYIYHPPGELRIISTLRNKILRAVDDTTKVFIGYIDSDNFIGLIGVDIPEIT